MEGIRVCFYATCSAEPDSSTLSERHNYAVIARSLFEERVRGCAYTRDYNVSFQENYLAISQLSGFLDDSGRASDSAVHRNRKSIEKRERARVKSSYFIFPFLPAVIDNLDKLCDKIRLSFRFS